MVFPDWGPDDPNANGITKRLPWTTSPEDVMSMDESEDSPPVDDADDERIPTPPLMEFTLLAEDDTATIPAASQYSTVPTQGEVINAFDPKKRATLTISYGLDCQGLTDVYIQSTSLHW